MRRIIETLLEEGIDESMVHRVLDLIEEEYEVIDEANMKPSNIRKVLQRRERNFKKAYNKSKQAEKNYDEAESNEQKARAVHNKSWKKLQGQVANAQGEGRLWSGNKKPGSPNIKASLDQVNSHEKMLKSADAIKQVDKKLSDANQATHDAEDNFIKADAERSKEYQKLLRAKNLVDNHYALKYGKDPGQGAFKLVTMKQAK